MAKSPKINTNLDDYNEDEFYKAIKLMKSQLTTNIGDFTGIPTAMTVFGPLIVTFDDKRTGPASPTKAAETAAARTAVQTVVSSNGGWLNTFCAGDLVKLKKTGYPLAKEAEAQGKLDATVLKLSASSMAGSIEFLISHIPGKGIKYGIMYALVANPEQNPAKWTFYYAAQRDGVITGLDSKKDYKMVSFGMGTDKDITYSDPVIISPQ